MCSIYVLLYTNYARSPGIRLTLARLSAQHPPISGGTTLKGALCAEVIRVSSCLYSKRLNCRCARGVGAFEHGPKTGVGSRRPKGREAIDSPCECEHNNPDSLDARLFPSVVLASRLL